MVRRTPMLSEDAFQRRVLDLAGYTGWLVYHTHDSRRSQAGFPDLVLAHRAKGVLFAELKSEAGKLSDSQREWIDTLTLAGARAYVWRPADWPIIEEVLKHG